MVTPADQPTGRIQCNLPFRTRRLENRRQIFAIMYAKHLTAFDNIICSKDIESFEGEGVIRS